MSVLTSLGQVETKVLTLLLWPMITVEERLNRGAFQRRFGDPSGGSLLAGHLERWLFVAIGVIAGYTTGVISMGLTIGVIVGFLLAVIIDPVYWAYKNNTDVERGDFKISAVVNFSVLYLFALGGLIGSVI